MPVPDAGFPVEVIRSVPVVTAPEDIDITNAAGLRTALLQAAARGHGTFVVDMSHTQFCDTAGIHALVSAHKRARAEGGLVLLVIGGAAIHRILSIIPGCGAAPQFLRVRSRDQAGPVSRSGPAGSPWPWS
jgi:anti-sigma B factor antagonist